MQYEHGWDTGTMAYKPQYAMGVSVNTRGTAGKHLSAVAANPSRAAATDPMVTAMCSQAKNVRSLAKKDLGSIFIACMYRERSRGT